VQIAFSGGRTSGYMLHRILEANGNLPERVEVCFQNTGREMPQTLDFIQECSERWQVPITWLEYRPEAPKFAVVKYESASRNGEPFEALIIKRKGLPYKFARFCTAEMKVHCATRYFRAKGWEKWRCAIGIRADEPRRIPTKPQRERWQPWHPLFHEGVSKHDISHFWKRQAFDLQLPNIKGKTPLGNCDGCFLKSEASIASLAREHPERMEWWIRMEKMVKQNGWGGKNPCFSPDRSYIAISDYVKAQGDWVFDTEGALCQADDGECTGMEFGEDC
jgi:3'-phosphoadenosine 5'-phosphosulfate sulfotransferase (PAPS reductase)/FAD synthetase